MTNTNNMLRAGNKKTYAFAAVRALNDKRLLLPTKPIVCGACNWPIAVI